jgi:hypothetical protein
MSLENWDKMKDEAANEGQAARYIASTEEVTPASVAAAYGIREESIRRAPSAHLPPLFIPPVNKRICGTIIGTHYMERRSGKSGDRKARDKVLVIEVDLDEPIPELGIEKGPAAMAGYHVVLVDELIRSARLLFMKSIKDEIAGVERELSEANVEGRWGEGRGAEEEAGGAEREAGERGRGVHARQAQLHTGQQAHMREAPAARRPGLSLRGRDNLSSSRPPPSPDIFLLLAET